MGWTDTGGQGKDNDQEEEEKEGTQEEEKRQKLTVFKISTAVVQSPAEMQLLYGHVLYVFIFQ